MFSLQNRVQLSQSCRRLPAFVFEIMFECIWVFFFYDTHISSSTQLSETAPVCYAVPPLLQALTGIVRFCLNHWCAVELFWQSLNTELAVCITKQIFLQQRVLEERDLASCRINSHLSQERLRIPTQKNVSWRNAAWKNLLTSHQAAMGQCDHSTSDSAVYGHQDLLSFFFLILTLIQIYAITCHCILVILLVFFPRQNLISKFKSAQRLREAVPITEFKSNGWTWGQSFSLEFESDHYDIQLVEPSFSGTFEWMLTQLPISYKCSIRG